MADYECEILVRLNIRYEGLKWCELGNQWTYVDGKPVKPAKAAYILHGVEHTSIDINGQDGALKLDLEKPLPKHLIGKFDVVTNYGTSEHVNNQSATFHNIDELCRLGGVMIHILPLALPGNFVRHCRYHYTQDFARSLAETCGYELIDSRLIDQEAYKYPKILIAAALKKGNHYTPKKYFTQIHGIEDSGDKTYTGNYMSPHRRLRRKLLAPIPILVKLLGENHQ